MIDHVVDKWQVEVT